MLHFLYRHKKDYSRFNIIRQMTENISLTNDISILLPFSKNQFFKYFFQRKQIINDFFISNYDTYVYDRQKISKFNPRAWWKYIQDWVNFRFSYYLLSDTQAHFEYWEELFGRYNGKHFVLPVLADRTLYYPAFSKTTNHSIKKILFYGSFIPLHGIEVILQAFSLLEKQDIPFDAELIGSGQMYNTMKCLYDKLSLKQVTMRGEILPENILANKIRQADIILGIFGESKKAQSVIPNKVYQALACKKAVITMQSATLYEFFTNQEILMCQRTPEALADTIKQCINHTAFMTAYQERGYQKFISLYQETEKHLITFLQSIDDNLNSN